MYRLLEILRGRGFQKPFKGEYKALLEFSRGVKGDGANQTKKTPLLVACFDIF